MIERVIVNRDHEAYCGDCIKYSTVNVLRCWVLRNIEGLENWTAVKISITFCPERNLDNE